MLTLILLHMPSASFLIFLRNKKIIIYYLLFIELLGAKRPQGKETPTSEILSVHSRLKVSFPQNWRTKASSIKNQGCGACWAFTTVGLYESFMMVKGKAEEDLSEQFIL